MTFFDKSIPSANTPFSASFHPLLRGVRIGFLNSRLIMWKRIPFSFLFFVFQITLLAELLFLTPEKSITNIIVHRFVLTLKSSSLISIAPSLNHDMPFQIHESAKHDVQTHYNHLKTQIVHLLQTLVCQLHRLLGFA